MLPFTCRGHSSTNSIHFYSTQSSPNMNWSSFWRKCSPQEPRIIYPLYSSWLSAKFRLYWEAAAWKLWDNAALFRNICVTPWSKRLAGLPYEYCEFPIVINASFTYCWYFFLLVFIFILKQMLILTSANQYMPCFLLLNCSTNTKQWWFMLVNVILKLVWRFLTANVVADSSCGYSC